MKIRPVHIVILLLLVFMAGELYHYEKTARVMGTTVRIKTNGPYLADYALDEIKRLEKLFSRFDKNSEISLINKLAGRAPLQLSADTAAVLKMAEDVRRASHGAFDVNGKQGLDLGGIGKGYAVESARRLLLKKGVRRAIIDMHSSIAVIGNGWQVGILDPRAQSTGKILGTIILNDGEALSTSGQYEQPGHIIDPRTGQPAKKCLSVTVIARDASLADALSTAAFVLGPGEGMKLIKKLGARAIFIDKNGTIYDNFGFKLR